MAVQKWEYCSLTIDHLDAGDKRQSVTFVRYGVKESVPQSIAPDDFGQFVARLGLESWELAGVSSDQPPPPGAHYRESWVFKRPLKVTR